jgi:hypothetical protein
MSAFLPFSGLDRWCVDVRFRGEVFARKRSSYGRSLCGPSYLCIVGRKDGQRLMGWIRANLRFGFWCALFALSVQFAVSFGHIHPVDFGRDLDSIGGSAVGVIAATAGDHGAPSKSDAPADDYCPICAVINLAGTVVSPVPPALAVAFFGGRILTWPSSEAPTSERPYRYAQARAPPQI